MRRFIFTAFIAAFALIATVPAYADIPGEHPHYLHAISDLRYARALLALPEEHNVKHDERAAVVEIDQALYEIRRAARDDRKDLDDHPPVDAGLSRRARFERVIDLLARADRDLHFEEDNRAAQGWRVRAIGDVRDALVMVRRAAAADRYDDRRSLQ